MSKSKGVYDRSWQAIEISQNIGENFQKSASKFMEILNKHIFKNKQ